MAAHGKVKIKRPGDAKARIVPASLWYAKQDGDDKKNQNPYFKMGYRIVVDPVGVTAKPAAKAKAPKQEVEPETDQENG